jgi:hypothetical protein
MATEGVIRAVLNPPFAQLTDRSIGLADPPDDDGPHHEENNPVAKPDVRGRRGTPSRRQAARGQTRTNPAADGPRGSNVLFFWRAVMDSNLRPWD